MARINPEAWVSIKTTLPALPLPFPRGQPIVQTRRLVLRRFEADDLEEFHVIRTQPEVMVRTIQGKPDADVQATYTQLAKRLPPNDKDNFSLAICVAETGQLIGYGGTNARDGELGWPVLGYIFRKEAWGRGYATEFLEGWLKAYWALPRAEFEIKVDPDSLDGAGANQDGPVRERIMAVTAHDNPASQRVLAKCGLSLVKIWEEELNGKTQPLHGFIALSPEVGGKTNSDRIHNQLDDME